MIKYIVITDVWDDGVRVGKKEIFLLEEEDYREIRQRLLNMAGYITGDEEE